MDLGIEVLILAVFMTLFSALPLYSAAARRYSKPIFLVGTGAMFGICFFDLVPDVFHLGGSTSLYVMGAVWLLYSCIHLFHLAHHQEDGHGNRHGHLHESRFLLFLASIVAHCFASGMLLTVSFGLSKRIASTVFAALLAHKIYEALLLASILMVQRRSSQWRAAVIAIYALALPVGAGLTYFFQTIIDQRVAILISSVAVGTLMGCLIFDFLLPSVQQLKEQRFRIGWVLAGLLLTQVVMRQI